MQIKQSEVWTQRDKHNTVIISKFVKGNSQWRCNHKNVFLYIPLKMNKAKTRNTPSIPFSISSIFLAEEQVGRRPSVQGLWNEWSSGKSCEIVDQLKGPSLHNYIYVYNLGKCSAVNIFWKLRNSLNNWGFYLPPGTFLLFPSSLIC